MTFALADAGKSLCVAFWAVVFRGGGNKIWTLRAESIFFGSKPPGGRMSPPSTFASRERTPSDSVTQRHRAKLSAVGGLSLVTFGRPRLSPSSAVQHTGNFWRRRDIALVGCGISPVNHPAFPALFPAKDIYLSSPQWPNRLGLFEKIISLRVR